MANLSPCDLVLVEGFKATPIPKLEVHRPANGKPLHLAGTTRPWSRWLLPSRATCRRIARCPGWPSTITTPSRRSFWSGLDCDDVDITTRRWRGCWPVRAGSRVPTGCRWPRRPAGCWRKRWCRRSMCRRMTTADGRLCGALSPTCRQAGASLPVAQRIPAGSVGHALAAGHGGAHLYRRAGTGRRRCRGDAGILRPWPERSGHRQSGAARRREHSPAGRGHSARRGSPAGRHAARPGGDRHGGLGRRRHCCRCGGACAWPSCPPATS